MNLKTTALFCLLVCFLPVTDAAGITYGDFAVSRVVSVYDAETPSWWTSPNDHASSAS